MAKQIEMAHVVSQEQIGDQIYRMWIDTPGIAAQARAGQFVSVYTGDAAHLLPRPISICEIDTEQGRICLVYRVVGFGTEEFCTYHAGDTVKIMGPLGNGFPLQDAPAVLVGGGIGIPPMLETAKALRKQGLAKDQVIAVLGYRNNQMFLKEELEAYATVVIATEDGSFGTKGTVIAAMQEQGIGHANQVMYSCGPTPMLRALKAFALERDMTCYVSMEERMACGIGACLACVCQSKDVDSHTHVHNKRICKDGPVFLATEVEL